MQLGSHCPLMTDTLRSVSSFTGSQHALLSTPWSPSKSPHFLWYILILLTESVNSSSTNNYHPIFDLLGNVRMNWVSCSEWIDTFQKIWYLGMDFSLISQNDESNLQCFNMINNKCYWYLLSTRHKTDNHKIRWTILLELHFPQLQYQNILMISKQVRL